MAEIRLEGVSRVFESGHAGVRDIDLTIRHGELVVLVGPSGSGKSTLLRLIAGLETPTSGRILIRGRDVTHVQPQDRDLAMVFQSYALYPHKNVRENLAFGLRMRGRPRREIDERVDAIASALQIEPLLDRRPAQLSGGQRQRVALGRAMVREPQAFLFDEPLSNLDPGLRLDTRAEIALLHRRLGATMVYVTHDQEEAMKLGERVVLLRDGRIEQAAPPMEIYRHPATVFAARFVGSPPMNLLDGHVSGGVLTLDVGTRLSLDIAHAEGGRVTLGIRPQDMVISRPDSAEMTGTVEVVEPAGSEWHVHVRLADQHRAIVVVPADAAVAVDATVGLQLRRERLHLFDSDGRSLVRR